MDYYQVIPEWYCEADILASHAGIEFGMILISGYYQVIHNSECYCEVDSGKLFGHESWDIPWCHCLSRQLG